MAHDASTPQLSAIIITDGDGERIVSKFWSAQDFPNAAAEQDFERKLFKKTKAIGVRPEAEVLMLDGFTVVFKAGPDVTFAVVGPGDENDLMLVAVLDALWDTMSLLLKGVVEKRTILAHLELLLLTLDELVEGGVPFELDAHTIEARVMLRGAVPDSISSYNEMTLSGVRGCALPAGPPAVPAAAVSPAARAPPPPSLAALPPPPPPPLFFLRAAGCGQAAGPPQEAVRQIKVVGGRGRGYFTLFSCFGGANGREEKSTT